MPPGLHYLPPLNPKSKDFAELFRSFLSSKDERTNILALSEDDARLFIEIIDRVHFSRIFLDPCSIISSLGVKAFRAARLEPELRNLALNVLRRLCGRIGHLPQSYLLSDKFDVSGPPRASGGFADLRMGTFKGKNVAAKSLRVSESDDKARIRKVGNEAASHLDSLTLCTALLQRICLMEELVPPQHPQHYRRS